LILAHGIGGRTDLPVPLSYFIAGAVVVLVASFVALAALWPKPRLQDGPRLRPLPANRLARAVGAAIKVAGLVALALTIAAGLYGSDESATNPAPVLVYVAFWLVVPFAGALAGNLYSFANPWRTMLAPLRGTERPELLERVGVWPATVALLGFVWLELVFADGGRPFTVGVAAVAYTVYLIAAAAYAGRDTGLQIADGFTTYSRLISAIAPFGFVEGRWVWRGWLRALTVVPAWRGLTAFTLAMIGSVTYDGLSGASWWRNLTGVAGVSMMGETVLLLAVVGTIGAAYLLACYVASRLGGGKLTTATVAQRFTHTLVPIALAYAFAHYFTLILFEGQLLLSSLSDPFALGWDLFGTADRRIDFTLLGPTGVWYTQVAAIVLGHVTGVILAHDRALSDFPAGTAVRTQYAMLGLMVGLTGLGLFVLAAG